MLIVVGLSLAKWNIHTTERHEKPDRSCLSGVSFQMWVQKNELSPRKISTESRAADGNVIIQASAIGFISFQLAL